MSTVVPESVNAPVQDGAMLGSNEAERGFASAVETLKTALPQSPTAVESHLSHAQNQPSSPTALQNTQLPPQPTAQRQNVTLQFSLYDPDVSLHQAGFMQKVFSQLSTAAWRLGDPFNIATPDDNSLSIQEKAIAPLASSLKNQGFLVDARSGEVRIPLGGKEQQEEAGRRLAQAVAQAGPIDELGAQGIHGLNMFNLDEIEHVPEAFRQGYNKERRKIAGFELLGAGINFLQEAASVRAITPRVRTEPFVKNPDPAFSGSLPQKLPSLQKMEGQSNIVPFRRRNDDQRVEALIGGPPKAGDTEKAPPLRNSSSEARISSSGGKGHSQKIDTGLPTNTDNAQPQYTNIRASLINPVEGIRGYVSDKLADIETFFEGRKDRLPTDDAGRRQKLELSRELYPRFVSSPEEMDLNKTNVIIDYTQYEKPFAHNRPSTVGVEIRDPSGEMRQVTFSSATWPTPEELVRTYLDQINTQNNIDRTKSDYYVKLKHDLTGKDYYIQFNPNFDFGLKRENTLVQQIIDSHMPEGFVPPEALHFNPETPIGIVPPEVTYRETQGAWGFLSQLAQFVGGKGDRAAAEIFHIYLRGTGGPYKVTGSWGDSLVDDILGHKTSYIVYNPVAKKRVRDVKNQFRNEQALKDKILDTMKETYPDLATLEPGQSRPVSFATKDLVLEPTYEGWRGAVGFCHVSSSVKGQVTRREDGSFELNGEWVLVVQDGYDFSSAVFRIPETGQGAMMPKIAFHLLPPQARKAYLSHLHEPNKWNGLNGGFTVTNTEAMNSSIQQMQGGAVPPDIVGVSSPRKLQLVFDH